MSSRTSSAPVSIVNLVETNITKEIDMTLTTESIAAPETLETDWLALARDISAQIAGDVAELDRTGDFAERSFDLVRETGIGAMLVPVEFGGGGASHAEACDVLREIGRTDPSTAVSLSMHFHIVATQVWRHKHGLDASAVLRKVAEQRVILISTGASDWLDASGEAVKVDGGYRVSARKAPASGCPAGDVLVTSIHWADGPDGPSVIHCSVPFASDGVEIEETWDSLGLRATGSHTVVLDDVFVPDAAVSLVRPAGQWHPIWNAVLGSALPLIMSAYIGAAEAMAAEATTIARSKAGASHVAPLVGRMHNALATAQDAVNASIAASDDLRFDNTTDHAAYVLTRKTIAAEALVAIARTAVDTVGGLGFSRHFSIERMFRDLHGSLFHPLPEAKQVEFTGRVALGLDPVGTA